MIRENWQPACLAGNLKSIRYRRALTSVLVKFSLKSHVFIFLLVLFRHHQRMWSLHFTIYTLL